MTTLVDVMMTTTPKKEGVVVIMTSELNTSIAAVKCKICFTYQIVHIIFVSIYQVECSNSLVGLFIFYFRLNKKATQISFRLQGLTRNRVSMCSTTMSNKYIFSKNACSYIDGKEAKDNIIESLFIY